jgi:hypothetical protein
VRGLRWSSERLEARSQRPEARKDFEAFLASP